MGYISFIDIVQMKKKVWTYSWNAENLGRETVGFETKSLKSFKVKLSWQPSLLTR